MTIEKNFLHKMSNTNEDNIMSMDFVLNLDLLNGCVHSCEGCYVNKRKVTANWKETLERAYKIASSLASKGLRFRELILGPTDFFSAENTMKVLKDPSFQKLLMLNEKTRITAACIFENIDKEHFKEIFAILDDQDLYREKMILEFLVPLNSKKIINRDQKYIEDNKWAIDFFATQSPKVIDWSFVVNIHSNELLKKHYVEVVDFIKQEFLTIVEFNPGFFRSNNRAVVSRNLTYWKSFLQDILSSHDPNELYLTNLDRHHNTENTVCLNFYEGDIYFSPFIYEQVVETDSRFLVQDESAEGILRQQVNLQVQAYNYAAKTESCANCNYLAACAGRNVLNFMESRELTACLFPEQFKNFQAS